MRGSRHNCRTRSTLEGGDTESFVSASRVGGDPYVKYHQLLEHDGSTRASAAKRRNTPMICLGQMPRSNPQFGEGL